MGQLVAPIGIAVPPKKPEEGRGFRSMRVPKRTVNRVFRILTRGTIVTMRLKVFARLVLVANNITLNCALKD